MHSEASQPLDQSQSKGSSRSQSSLSGDPLPFSQFQADLEADEDSKVEYGSLDYLQEGELDVNNLSRQTSSAKSAPTPLYDSMTKEEQARPSRLHLIFFMVPLVSTAVGLGVGLAMKAEKLDPASLENIMPILVAGGVAAILSFSIDRLARCRHPFTMRNLIYQAYITTIALSTFTGITSTALLITFSPFWLAWGSAPSCVPPAITGWICSLTCMFGLQILKSSQLIKLFLMPVITSFLGYFLGLNLFSEKTGTHLALNILLVCLSALFAGVLGYFSWNTLYKIGHCHIPELTPARPRIENNVIRNSIFKMILATSSFTAIATSALLTNYSPNWLIWGSLPEWIPPVTLGIVAATVLFTLPIYFSTGQHREQAKSSWSILRTQSLLTQNDTSLNSKDGERVPVIHSGSRSFVSA